MSALPIPEAYYACKHCSEECSYPASMLFWSEAEKAWVCEKCWDDAEEPRGTCLADVLRERQGIPDPSALRELVEAARKLLAYAERNTCLHEETHRGGIIWEICNSCGQKWADDEGGIPTADREWPDEIAGMQAALAKLKGGAL